MHDYKGWFEAIPIPMFVWDWKDLSFLEVNEAAVSLYGYSRGEFARMNLKDIRPPEDIPIFLKGVRRVSSSIRSHGCYRHRKKDGSIIAVEILSHRTDWRGRAAGISALLDVTERRRLEAEILSVGEAERSRIGRDLHDDVGPALTGMALSCKAAGERLRARGAPEADLAAQMCRALNEVGLKVRSLAGRLFPADLETLGLPTVLQCLCEQTSELSGARCSFKSRFPLPGLPGDLALHLYRIAQEAVNNALKHAKAGRIVVRLAGVRGRAALTVADDGSGFAERRRSDGGLGLRTMRYRADVLGGSLRIRTGPGKGTVVRCVAPLPRKRRASR